MLLQLLQLLGSSKSRQLLQGQMTWRQAVVTVQGPRWMDKASRSGRGIVFSQEPKASCRPIVERQVQAQAKKSQNHIYNLGSGLEPGRHRTGQRQHTCSIVQAEIKGRSLSLKTADRHRGTGHSWDLQSWP